MRQQLAALALVTGLPLPSSRLPFRRHLAIISLLLLAIIIIITASRAAASSATATAAATLTRPLARAAKAAIASFLHLRVKHNIHLLLASGALRTRR